MRHLLRAVWRSVLRHLWWKAFSDFSVEIYLFYPFSVGESIVTEDRVYRLAKIANGRAYWERIL